jgi:large subunit ribosomal protein L22
MEFISTQKYLRLSPSKIREVVFMIKKLSPQKAIETLPFVNKRASKPLLKVISTALAQAKEKGVAEDKVFIKEIQINEGPRLKRGMPVSRGRWHPIVKRMSHIRVVLGVKEEKKVEEVKKPTETKKTVKKEIKKETKNK